MITRQDLFDRVDEVNSVIRWWCYTNSKWTKMKVAERGSVNDFISDVWVRMLLHFRNDERTVDASLSLIVVNNCHWEIISHKKDGYSEHTREFRRRLRNAEPVEPSHKMIDDIDLSESQHKDINEAILIILRSIHRKEAMILRARFGLLGDDEMTLEQIAQYLNRTRERVRQLEVKGLDRIKGSKLVELLFPFVGEGQVVEARKQRERISSKKKPGKYLAMLIEHVSEVK